MSALGRLMQIGGLILLPLSMLLELTKFLGRDFGVSDMVIMLLFGAGLFWAGRLVEGYATR
jgi:hypothetical protein